MRKLTIYLLLISNILLSQNYQQQKEAEKLIDIAYNKLIIENGVSINFDYLFQNNSHDMKQPINGRLSLYSNNRYHLEFMNVIEFYDGETVYTILNDEKEIQIDNLREGSGVFIQNIFTNYKSKFNSKIKERIENIIITELIPKKKYNPIIFNNCIDTLNLPSCLKIPKQCKIGISIISQKKLNECLEENRGIEENNILEIDIEIDSVSNELISITQLNRYNGQTIITIKDKTIKDEKCLKIDTILYKDFEIIDLR